MRKEELTQNKDAGSKIGPEIRGTVAGALAASMIAESLRKGNSIEIPSLGITITKEDLEEK